ncbi:MAG TPA: sugar MFS transporter [Sphingomonas sp.]|uniref:sugar MFS transporter n=1 Tax=Sphingomonas sp. TaxID=28214 RepID=UPI002CE86C9B|nr:sugar MFS transporter [Sphingomonas sp.]HMI19906.1 sugar MFS transporter [Sphingomonas sp.]
MATTAPRQGLAFVYVTTLFFIWGAVTSVNDILLPAVKEIFTLTDTQGFLTQFAFFMAYFVVSLPAAAIVSRLGSARSIILALAVMVLGCLLMPVATYARTYTIVLVALFVIASGITLLQVAANPLSAVLGPPEKSHFRLVFSQAFNSLGTVIGPYLAAHTLLQGGLFEGGAPTEAKIVESLGRIDTAYYFIAAVIVLLAIFLFSVRDRITAAAPAIESGAGGIGAALASKWALLGAAAIFLYVGAEVSIGSTMVNFLEQPNILGIAAEQAGKLVSLYWLGAMIGRFLGSGLLTRIPAGRLLTFVASVAALLCLIVSQIHGHHAAAIAISIGLFNSIMFPVIFTLTLERSTAPAPATSGLLCMAIVGGALMPLVFAKVADMTASRSTAFLVPMACYVLITLFALAAGRARIVGEAGPKVGSH